MAPSTRSPPTSSLIQVAVVLLGLAGFAQATVYRVATYTKAGATLIPLNEGLSVNVRSIDYSVLDAASRASTNESLSLGYPVVVNGTVTGTKLVVATVYLGFPGYAPQSLFVTVTNGALFYKASILNTARTLSLVKNTTKLVVSGPLIDESYQLNQVLNNSAIVSSASPSTFSITATEVFIKLPAKVGPCTVVRLAACPRGQIRTYYRDPNLCVQPGPCVRGGVVCIQGFPSCPLSGGYTRHSWLSATGCPAYACDPNFIQGF